MLYSSDKTTHLLFLEHLSERLHVVLPMPASVDAQVAHGRLALDTVHADVLLPVIAALYNVRPRRFANARRRDEHVRGERTAPRMIRSTAALAVRYFALLARNRAGAGRNGVAHLARDLRRSERTGHEFHEDSIPREREHVAAADTDGLFANGTRDHRHPALRRPFFLVAFARAFDDVVVQTVLRSRPRHLRIRNQTLGAVQAGVVPTR